MKWHHIMNKQPKDGDSIVQINPPYDGFYGIGMRDYNQKCSFKELMDFNTLYDIPNPDFWWMLSEDFPFPDKKI